MSNTQTNASPTASTAADVAHKTENQSLQNFAASLSAGAVVFGIQIAVFLILSGNWKLHRAKASGSEKAEVRQSLFHKI
jgi:hypothetical protein